MFRLTAAALIVAMLTACSVMKRPVAEEDLVKTKRVGVVSILGDTFHGISIGTMVFNNAYFQAPVADWNVDKYATTTALGLLRSTTQFESVEMDRGQLSLEKIQADKGQQLWAAAEKQGFDKVVIIRPGVSSNFPHFRPGFGLMERSLLGAGRRCMYAAYVVDVYEVASRKEVAWEWGGYEPCRIGGDNEIAFKAKFDDYSPAEQQAMRKKLEMRIAETLRYSLTKLALVPEVKVAK